MSRPSRTPEALAILRSYYQQNGILPTIEVMTQLMGYRSSGSTFPVIKALVADGYLEQEERGGRLKPGIGFVSGQSDGAPAFQLSYPVGCKTIRATCASLPELAVLPGDVLVYDPNTKPAADDVLVVHSGKDVFVQSFSLGAGAPSGFLGVIQFQYRSYLS